MDENRKKELVSSTESESIRDAVLAWINSCPLKPMNVRYDFIGKTSGIAIATVQSAYKVRRYIYGGYMAQYQFVIVYRLIAENDKDRMAADELLNSIGCWMEENIPETPESVNMWRISRDNTAAFSTPYENGAEDHNIQMTLTYEVI